MKFSLKKNIVEALEDISDMGKRPKQRIIKPTRFIINWEIESCEKTYVLLKSLVSCCVTIFTISFGLLNKAWMGSTGV